MDCLIIKKEFLDKIFSGHKTWEIRGSKTHKRGKIGLIQSGSGTIVGECELIGCSDELTIEHFLANKDKHQSSNNSLSYKKTYAWILKNAKKYEKPIKYKHPLGAIIWVKV